MMSSLFASLRIGLHALPYLPGVVALLLGLVALGAGLAAGRVVRWLARHHPALRRIAPRRLLRTMARPFRSGAQTRKGPGKNGFSPGP
ncbi:hypothetical protein [Nioella nitratireducens]|uniref:hypothetical protein n=1 Tax=Nioella nitratireducens TaxID=1287720 RepID=UPI001314A3C5|nr:hypothetical protein [Nioella nitratireducens]